MSSASSVRRSGRRDSGVFFTGRTSNGTMSLGNRFIRTICIWIGFRR